MYLKKVSPRVTTWMNVPIEVAHMRTNLVMSYSQALVMCFTYTDQKHIPGQNYVKKIDIYLQAYTYVWMNKYDVRIIPEFAIV